MLRIDRLRERGVLIRVSAAPQRRSPVKKSDAFAACSRVVFRECERRSSSCEATSNNHHIALYRSAQAISRLPNARTAPCPKRKILVARGTEARCENTS